jgi:hypothetical protein
VATEKQGGSSMKVSELIDLLKEQDQEAQVAYWSGPYLFAVRGLGSQDAYKLSDNSFLPEDDITEQAKAAYERTTLVEVY